MMTDDEDSDYEPEYQGVVKFFKKFFYFWDKKFFGLNLKKNFLNENFYNFYNKSKNFFRILVSSCNAERV